MSEWKDLKTGDVVGGMTVTNVEKDNHYGWPVKLNRDWCNQDVVALLLAKYPVYRDGKPLQEAPVSEQWKQWLDQRCSGSWINGQGSSDGILCESKHSPSHPVINGILVEPDSIRPVSEDVEWEPATEPFQEGDVATAPNGNQWIYRNPGAPTWHTNLPGVTTFLYTTEVRALGLTVTRKKSKPSAVPNVVKGTVFNEGCWCLIEGIRFDRCTDGYWRNTDHGLLVKDSDVRVFGVKVEKSKPSAVPTNVVESRAFIDPDDDPVVEVPKEWDGEPVTVILDSAIVFDGKYRDYNGDTDDNARVIVVREETP